MFTKAWAFLQGVFQITKLFNSIVNWLESLRNKEKGRKEVRDVVNKESADAQARMDAVPDSASDDDVRGSMSNGTF
jgi:hypothetical protein